MATPNERLSQRLAGALRATAVMASPITNTLTTHWIEDGTAEFAVYLRSQGVGVVASAAFSTERDPPDAVRICLGGPSTLDECEHGLQMVADTLRHPPHQHATAV